MGVDYHLGVLIIIAVYLSSFGSLKLYPHHEHHFSLPAPYRANSRAWFCHSVIFFFCFTCLLFFCKCSFTWHCLWHCPQPSVSRLPWYARMCQDIPRCATICRDVPQYARKCHDVPGCVTICHNMQRYARMCRDVPQCATICHDVPRIARQRTESVLSPSTLSSHTERTSAGCFVKSTV